MRNVDLATVAVAGLHLPPCRILDRDDHLGAGLLGLCEAARAFDPARNESFREFALRWVRGRIRDQLREVFGLRRAVREPAFVVRIAPGLPEGVGEADVPDRRACDAAEAAGRLDLAVLLERLGPDERTVIERHDLGGEPLRRSLPGRTESRACQVRRRALEKMREEG